MNFFIDRIEDAVKEYRNVMSDTQNNSFFATEDEINTCSENDAKHAFLKMLIKLHNTRTPYKLLHVGSKKVIKIRDDYLIYEFSSYLRNIKIIKKENEFYFCYSNSLEDMRMTSISFSDVEEYNCESFNADFVYDDFSFHNYGQFSINQNDEKIYSFRD